MDLPYPIQLYQELVGWVRRSLDKLALKEEMIERSFVTTGILNSSEDSISHFNHRLQSLLKYDDDWDLEEINRKKFQQPSASQYLSIQHLILNSSAIIKSVIYRSVVGRPSIHL